MTYNDAVAAIYRRLQANYSLDDDRIIFDGDGGEEPEGGNWARLTVVFESSDQSTLGVKTNRKFERFGRILTQVFTPAESGRLEADLLAQEANDLFEGEEFEGVTVLSSVCRPVGPDGKWYIILVDSEFKFETIK
jgi:hypothetical protein